MAFSNNEKTQIIASLVNEKMDYVFQFTHP